MKRQIIGCKQTSSGPLSNDLAAAASESLRLRIMTSPRYTGRHFPKSLELLFAIELSAKHFMFALACRSVVNRSCGSPCGNGWPLVEPALGRTPLTYDRGFQGFDRRRLGSLHFHWLKLRSLAISHRDRSLIENIFNRGWGEPPFPELSWLSSHPISFNSFGPEAANPALVSNPLGRI
jgi:hypothetical protein